MRAQSLSPVELAEALENDIQSKNLGWGEEAATRLLIAHGYWLDCQVLRPHIKLIGGRRTTLKARLVWSTVCDLPDNSRGPSAEDDILRLACHLAGCIPGTVDDSWTLAEIVGWFDIGTTLLANRAFALATLGPQAVRSLD